MKKILISLFVFVSIFSINKTTSAYLCGGNFCFDYPGQTPQQYIEEQFNQIQHQIDNQPNIYDPRIIVSEPLIVYRSLKEATQASEDAKKQMDIFSSALSDLKTNFVLPNKSDYIESRKEFINETDLTIKEYKKKLETANDSTTYRMINDYLNYLYSQKGRSMATYEQYFDRSMREFDQNILNINEQYSKAKLKYDYAIYYIKNNFYVSKPKENSLLPINNNVPPNKSISTENKPTKVEAQKTLKQTELTKDTQKNLSDILVVDTIDTPLTLQKKVGWFQRFINWFR